MTDQSKQHPGAIIKARRNALNITQLNLAELVGCLPNTLRSWEQQRATPSPGYQRLVNMELDRLEKEQEEQRNR